MKDTNNAYSWEEVSQVLKISEGEAKEFEQEGIFEFEDEAKTNVTQENFSRLKSAITLKREFGVNMPGIDIILGMKEKMSRVQSDFDSLLSQLSRRLSTQVLEDMKEIEKNLKS